MAHTRSTRLAAGTFACVAIAAWLVPAPAAQTARDGIPVEAAVDAVVDWVERRENASPSAETVKVSQ